MMNMSMIRHHFVMRNGVDPKYASKVNPLERNAENIAAGKKLYEKSCALCHGMTGWQTRTPYDESTYLNALRRSSSPLLNHLEETTEKA